MEDTMPCPGCKSPQDGGIHEGYRHYECGSFSHATGDCLQPSKACKRLAYMNQEYKSADDHGTALVKACESFRDDVLHGIDQFENWQTNAVLDLFDNVIGGKL